MQIINLYPVSFLNQHFFGRVQLFTQLSGLLSEAVRFSLQALVFGLCYLLLPTQEAITKQTQHSV